MGTNFGKGLSLSEADLRLISDLDFMGKLGYNTHLGDALHRRECTLKNSKPTMIKSRKMDQNLNAVKTSREYLLAKKEAILSMLGESFRQPVQVAFAA